MSDLHNGIFYQVEVDLALSAHANARCWYELKKKQEFKQEKTVTAHEKAFKAAEKKTRLQLAQVLFFVVGVLRCFNPIHLRDFLTLIKCKCNKKKLKENWMR